MTKELLAGVSCECWGAIDKYLCRVCRILEQEPPQKSSRCSVLGSEDSNLPPPPSNSSMKLSCEQCEIEDRLWTCLVCGYVGCGRYTSEHSLKHYISSGHRWALDITQRRIWDYSEDNYAHRLPGGTFGNIGQDRPPSLTGLPGDFKSHQRDTLQKTGGGGYHGNTCGGGGGYDLKGGTNDDGSGGGIGSKSGKLGNASYFDAGDFGDQMNVAKIGGLASEYEQLLMLQLSEQRRYYEQILAKEVARIAEENESVDGRAAQDEQIQIEQIRLALVGIEKEYKTALEVLREAETKLRNARKEQVRLLAEQSQKEQLVRSIKAETSEAQRSCENHVTELEATITELTFFHRTRQEISQSPNKEEIRSGHVLVGEGASPQKDKRNNKNRRNGKR
mmetsp:Transcript_54238/g.69722  ORF Transcript_54238/g.69722 Transcript_54238/m.69722 type:complete len:391 (+) Transcript_54238:236-1408(+)